jgi:hypothetical protein
VEPVLIDLTPMAVCRARRGTAGRIAASLGMFAHGAADVSGAGDRLRFLTTHYDALLQATDGALAATLGPRREWIERAEAVRDRESRRRHARRDRHWRRGCRGMKTLDRRTRYVAALSEHEAARLLALPGDAGEIDGRAVRVVRRSPSAVRAGWERGHALRRRGLPVAEPLICREEAHVGTLVVAAGPPVVPSPETHAAAVRLCERLREWGFMLDGPQPRDFAQDPDGGLTLACPVDVRPAGRDEPAPVPDFAHVAERTHEATDDDESPAVSSAVLSSAAVSSAAVPSLRRAA